MRAKLLITLIVSMFAVACAGATTKGVVIMAHGGDAAWNANVERAAEPLQKRWPVEIAYGMAVSSALETAVARLEKKGVKRIAVVRMFVSGESWIEETEYIFGLKKELPAAKIEAHAKMHHHGGSHGGHKMEAPRPIERSAEVTLSREGVGDSPLVDGILLDRVKALSTKPAEETVLVLAHGPADDAENERWLANMNRRLEPLHELGAFRKVEIASLREDWPEKRRGAEEQIRAIVQEGNQNGGRVIVVPFRISGFGPYREVLKGLTYVADEKGFLPHPNMTRWIEETAATLLDEP